MKKDAKLEDLFQECLEELYAAEKQIVAALPKMIAASASEELSTALASHLDETKTQVSRLETIFERMGEQPGAGESRPMEALLSEGERLIGDMEKSPVLDTALIGAAQKVEHYEIAAYTTACSLAEVLGQQDAVEMLQETLDEETDADATLGDIAQDILGQGEDEEDEEIDEEVEEEVE